MTPLEFLFILLILFFLFVGFLLYWDNKASRVEDRKKQAQIRS